MASGQRRILRQPIHHALLFLLHAHQIIAPRLCVLRFLHKGTISASVQKNVIGRVHLDKVQRAVFSVARAREGSGVTLTLGYRRLELLGGARQISEVCCACAGIATVPSFNSPLEAVAKLGGSHPSFLRCRACCYKLFTE